MLKYYNEVQIMRNEMEHSRNDNGTITVMPDVLKVREGCTLSLTYTVGKMPIEIGGVIRFTIPFGFTAPQVDKPWAPGYCTARVTRCGAEVKTKIIHTEWWKRGPERTKIENVSEHVGNHVWVTISGHRIEEGDQVILIYGDSTYNGMACSKACPTTGPVQFDAATDRKGQLEAPYSGFYLTEKPAIVQVEPERPEKIEVIIPSEIQSSRPFKVTILLVDRYHNLTCGFAGSVELFLNEDRISIIRFSEEEEGIIKSNIQVNAEGIIRIKACWNGMDFFSNPAISRRGEEREDNHFFHYWGDPHGHTGIQWGRRSGRAYYEYAKEVAALDFCALTDPCAGRYTDRNETAKEQLSCYMTDEKWRQIQQVNREFYEPGTFVPILGYEYHNDAPASQFGGDRNVYYSDYNQPILRCCDEGSYCPEQLWEKFEKLGIRAITVPHHTAKKMMPGSWEMHDEKYQRLVEIYSSWGNSEAEGCHRSLIGGSDYAGRSVQDGLNRGYRLGFVAGSDTHAGTPGYSHWVFSEEITSYRGGLTCVKTAELTREAIFDALWNRRVYATTGERIILDVDCNGHEMGEEFVCGLNTARKFKILAAGTGIIEKVEIIRQGKIVYCERGKGEQIEFSWEDNSFIEQGWAYYYIRITQKDKAMAWSSPVWVNLRPEVIG